MKKMLIVFIMVIAMVLSTCAANKATTTATDNMNTKNTATTTAKDTTTRPNVTINTAKDNENSVTAIQLIATQHAPTKIVATDTTAEINETSETAIEDEERDIEIGDYTLKVEKYNLWDESQHDTRSTLYYGGNFVCDEVQAYTQINDKLFVLRGPCGIGYYEMGYYYECIEVHKGCQIWHVYMPQIEDLTNEEDVGGFFSKEYGIYEGTTNTWVIEENENKYTILVRSYVDINDHVYYAISDDVPEEEQNPMAMEMHEFTEWTKVNPKNALKDKTFEMFNIVY